MKVLPSGKPTTIMLYTSHEDGIWAEKEMQPVFKPLSEIPNVGDTVEDGNISKGEMAVLYFILPIVLLHKNEDTLLSSVDTILNYCNADGMDNISKIINDHYKLSGGGKLITLPICDADFMVEEFDLIKQSLGHAMAEHGYTKTPIMKDTK